MEARYKLATPTGDKIITLSRIFREENKKKIVLWVFTPHGRTKNIASRKTEFEGTPLFAATSVAAEFYGGATAIKRLPVD